MLGLLPAVLGRNELVTAVSGAGLLRAAADDPAAIPR